MSKKTKEELFMWACGQFRELVDGEAYGDFEVTLEKGRVVTARKVIKEKPPVDFVPALQ